MKKRKELTEHEKERLKKLAEQIKRQIRIEDYAQKIGFTIIHKGKYLSLKEHDSVIIDPVKNCFWRNSNGASGSIIDFALQFTNQDKKAIIKDFIKQVNNMPTTNVSVFTETIHSSKSFNLPERDNNIKNIYAYLINTRKIDKSLVAKWITEKRLYQDKYKNCVFVSYSDDKADFASIRGTNTYKKFIGDVAGSNYEHCFFIPNRIAQELIVTESCIDLLSVLTYDKTTHNYNQLALSGTQKHPAIYNILKENPHISKIYLALDNDVSGKETIHTIKEKLKNWNGEIIDYLPPQEKDWNAYLQSLSAQKKTPIEEYCCQTADKNKTSNINIEIE